MSAQIIEKNGKTEFAVVPIDEYNLLLEAVEGHQQFIQACTC